MPDNAHYRALRNALWRFDTEALGEAHRVFSNSRAVADRLLRYNGVKATVLYPPLLRPEIFNGRDHGDEIVAVCRLEHHKRQHLLIEAMNHVSTPVRLRLCGSGPFDYMRELQRMATRLDGKVAIESRWISEEEKASRLATALASAYVPVDEDSYGYPTLEAAQACRCTVTASDAGGVCEFVTDGDTGLVTVPDPRELGAAFDRLFEHRDLALGMGLAARRRIAELGINWEAVVAGLTQ
jgi:glycosyltransferase involved in cell wall biosynthesis